MADGEAPKRPRVLVFSGKGGVGKTTLAAATGLHAARSGHRTIVVSIDMAHSLADAFDLTREVQAHPRGTPYRVEANLEIQEIDVQEEVTRHWQEVHRYLSVLLAESGMDEVLAEDLALIPGMEDVIALLYLNGYLRGGQHDLIVLDLAPTAESLRFVSMPDTLDWYMRRVFKFERRLAKAVRPIASRLAGMPLPEDSYYEEIARLWQGMEGIDQILSDPATTTVRLVTNAERMVVKETQRAHLYFSLHGVVVDEILVNRVLPPPKADERVPRFLANWYDSQRENLETIRSSFTDLDIHTIPFMEDEVVGRERLARVAAALYGPPGSGRDPTRTRRHEPPYRLEETDTEIHLRVRLPHLDKSQLDLWVEQDELILRIASQKEHVPLPRRLARSTPSAARHADGWLTVTFPRRAAEPADTAGPLPVRTGAQTPQGPRPETDKSERAEALNRRGG